MTTENQAPVAGLPDFDPKADRGSDFTPTDEDPNSLVVQIQKAELDALVKGGEVKVEEAKPEDKGDEVKVEEKVEAKVEEVKPEEKKVEEQPRDEKTGKFIPKARFDEVNNKAKARVKELEAANAQLRERLGLVDGKKPDLSALEKELGEKSKEFSGLVADGKVELAGAVMLEINALNRKIGSIEASAITGEHVQETQNVDALGQLVELYKEAFPVFDDSKPDVYKQEYVDYVADLQGRFEITGSSPAEALREAVELAVAKFGLDSAPVAAAEPAVEPGKVKEAERVAAAAAAAVKAAGGQPKTLAKVGMDSDKAGGKSVSLDQIKDYKVFDKLAQNPETLARLRGDFVS